MIDKIKKICRRYPITLGFIVTAIIVNAYGTLKSGYEINQDLELLIFVALLMPLIIGASFAAKKVQPQSR